METAVLAERLVALDSAGGGGCEAGELAELVAIVERLHTMVAVETAGFDASGALTADGYRSPAVINQLADEAWRAQRNTDSTEPVDPAETAVDGGLVAEESSGDESGGNRPSMERRHPVRGRLVSQAAAELAARARSDGGAGGGGRVAKPVVVVVMDWVTFTAEAERFATGTAPPADVFAPEFRSETLDGHPLPPDQAFLLALRGEIQRCVVGAESLKVDLGRQQRLFKRCGAAGDPGSGSDLCPSGL